MKVGNPSIAYFFYFRAGKRSFQKSFSDAFFMPFKDDEGRVYAARYGSTVFKKDKN